MATAQKKKNELHDREVAHFCQGGLVEYLHMIHSVEDGKQGYKLLVKLEGSKKEKLMITHTAKQPRRWASLDRAFLHFQTAYGYQGRVIVDLGEN